MLFSCLFDCKHVDRIKICDLGHWINIEFNIDLHLGANISDWEDMLNIITNVKPNPLVNDVFV